MKLISASDGHQIHSHQIECTTTYKTSDNTLFHVTTFLDTSNGKQRNSLQILQSDGVNISGMYKDDDDEDIAYDECLLNIMNFICSWEMGCRKVHTK